ncbi:hypothetical protein CHLRE_03g143847v5 [Chlamydomonas reinhardtii]|nr:uncharacterized protein CHLRE_03g143847v5 [Chlamydomonas reinhardtii]PNW84380.1 hypothetical protein CHLRE_03g143847v5 [Chlamydomonas reinhardtii]
MGLLDVAKAPILNDVATDLNDPPTYIVSAARHGPIPESWKPRIRNAYPYLQPLLVAAGQGGDQQQKEVVAIVMDAATSLARSTPRWEVVHVQTHEDAAAGSPAGGVSGDTAVGLLEAVSTTKMMRFKDDIMVRLRLQQQQQQQDKEAAPGSDSGVVLRVDVRSASRVGKGDLGTNAARIKGFLGQLKEELQKHGIQILSS